MRALRANGFSYVCIGLNKHTQSEFYLFEASEALQNYKDNIYPKERDEF